MTERLRRIRFENFRGLASTEVKLNGKSLVVLGTNGKGKSAIVDGIEFLFSGKVGRFIGAGTGSINHDEAIQHVAKRGTPKVEISLSPSNVSINRDLGESPVLSDGGAVANDFLESHPEVDAFILRRGRILDFVSDQDANRYQKFVKLLGISEIDGMQRTFSDAERSAGEARQRAESSLATKLAVFRDPIDAFGPSSSGEVLAVIASKALALSAGTVGQWADIDPILLALKARRPEAHGELLERITRGVVCLENPLPNDIADDVTSVNQARTRMIALGDSLADAPRMKLLAEATKYLAGHGEESNCPICERGFEHSTAEVLARLRRRSEALTELAELTDRRKAALRRILSFCEGSCAQAVKDLVHRDFFDPVSIDALEIARELAKASADALRQFSATSLAEEVSLPRELTELGALRKALLLKLSTQRSALIPSETAELEAAI